MKKLLAFVIILSFNAAEASLLGGVANSALKGIINAKEYGKTGMNNQGVQNRGSNRMNGMNNQGVQNRRSNRMNGMNNYGAYNRRSNRMNGMNNYGPYNMRSSRMNGMNNYGAYNRRSSRMNGMNNYGPYNMRSNRMNGMNNYGPYNMRSNRMNGMNNYGPYNMRSSRMNGMNNYGVNNFAANPNTVSTILNNIYQQAALIQNSYQSDSNITNYTSNLGTILSACQQYQNTSQILNQLPTILQYIVGIYNALNQYNAGANARNLIIGFSQLLSASVGMY